MDQRYQSFLDLCRARYSCRKYNPDRTVPHDLIEQCAEAARLAPSACNRQPWRFVVIDDQDLLQNIRETCRMPGIAHPWWDDVPVFVALCAEREFFTHKFAASISGLPYWALDVGIAGEHFVLAAEALGLATCWVGWFKEKPLKRILNIPKATRVLSLLTLGYPLDPPPENRRPRLELGQIITYNQAPARSLRDKE